MTEEQLEEMMSNEDVKAKWEGDNALQGFMIIGKYIDFKKHTILEAAGHEIVYGPSLSDLAEAGITEEDVKELRRLNWMSEDGSLACFV